MRKLIAIGALAAAVTAASASGSGPSLPAQAGVVGGTAASATGSRPGDFSPKVDNPWFPLQPGTTLVYRGTKDGKRARVSYSVTSQVQRIDGVRCRVVLDRLFLNGVLAETTRDYYTQDARGNVWYFGEDTATLDRQGNMISTDGTWHAGEAGAFPGIFMPAKPTVGASYRQEFYAGHAEDHFRILDLEANASVPYGRFRSALLTKEWTPLEPDVIDHKYWARGIGQIQEVSVTGPLERLVLVDVKTN